MKSILIISIISLIIASGGIKDTNNSLKIELLKIEYYSSSGCSEKSPVLVRVIFSSNDNDIKNLKMVMEYPDDITITMPVKEKDTEGNIVYSFCAQKDATIEFNTRFVKSNGDKSKLIFIKCDVQNSEKQAITPPVLINL